MPDLKKAHLPYKPKREPEDLKRGGHPGHQVSTRKLLPRVLHHVHDHLAIRRDGDAAGLPVSVSFSIFIAANDDGALRPRDSWRVKNLLGPTPTIQVSTS